MRCIWCGYKTTTNIEIKNKITLYGNKEYIFPQATRYANKEHIFPEAVEGKKTLDLGKVCESCNNELGIHVDAHLRDGNLAMIRQYQESSIIRGKPIGKPRSGEDSERKKSQVNYFEVPGQRDKTIERDGDITTFTNWITHEDGRPIDLDFNDGFSKAILKCAINFLYHQRTYEEMHATYAKALKYIKDKGWENSYNWPYATCYSHVFSRNRFEPMWRIQGRSATKMNPVMGG